MDKNMNLYLPMIHLNNLLICSDMASPFGLLSIQSIEIILWEKILGV